MGTTVEAVATAHPVAGVGRGALRLADGAARRCLERSGRVPSDLDMLVNAGIYRDDSLGEPALAALIQEDIGASPRQPPATTHGTFSFDVANGPCGALNAMSLLDGFMRSRIIDVGMVVASDAPPRRARGYRFPRVGGALLLGWDPQVAGFTAFEFETFPEYADLFQSRLQWEGTGRLGRRQRRGRHRLVVQESPDYLARCVDCAERATTAFLSREGLAVDALDVIVVNEPAAGFADALADRLALPRARLARPQGRSRGAHTAGLPAALEAAQRGGQWDAARTALLVTAGAGITVAVALHRR